MSHLRNILIINQPVGNRGDEAAHRALMHALNAALPETCITVLAFMDSIHAYDAFRVSHPNNEYVNLISRHNLGAQMLVEKYLVQYRLVRIGTYLHPILRQILPYYRNADLVLCAPGGICMGGFQNWQHLYFLQLAKILHKPLFYFGRSVGPFPTQTRLNRRFWKVSLQLLRYMDYISIRDDKSQKLLSELKINFQPTVDSAFMEAPSVLIPTEVQHLVGTQPYLVVVPNQLCWHYAYRHVSQETIDQFYQDIICHLQQTFPGYSILLLPQLCSIGEAGDATYFRRLVEKFHLQDVVALPDTYGEEVQQTIISKARLVVGARYHSIVFAINNGVPFLALSYEHKMDGLLHTLQLDCHSISIYHTFDSSESVSDTLSVFRQRLSQLQAQKPSPAQARQLSRWAFQQMLTRMNEIHTKQSHT